MTATARTPAPAARPKAKPDRTQKTDQPAPGTVAPEVKAYLTALPPDQRAALQRLRETIRSVVPDAIEVISYGIPMFKLGKRGLVAYNASGKGGTLQVMSSAVLAAHAAELAGWRTGKGSIQFTPEEPLPEDLVAQLVRERIAENERLKKK